MTVQQTSQKKATRAKKPMLVAGPDRPEGVAGMDGDYIVRNLARWRLRGDGVLKGK